jgi:ATP-dependent Lhr-like helicase
LVALGVVNSDSFGGLRALLVPSSRRGRTMARSGRRKRQIALFAMADAGRWAIVQRPHTISERPDGAAVELVVRTLLRRWGVIFWKLLAREAAWLPPWREILTCCRRLEARGEIRGGRFVAGFSGEQYAAPEAVAPLREARRRPHARRYVAVSGADPLNLLGIVTPGTRLASLTGNRLLYLDGLPVAVYVAGEVQFLESLAPKEQWEAQNAVQRRHIPAALIQLDDSP